MIFDICSKINSNLSNSADLYLLYITSEMFYMICYASHDKVGVNLFHYMIAQ